MPDADVTGLARGALAATAASAATLLAVSFLGPSAAEPPLGPRGLLPPYSLAAQPSSALVSVLLAAAYLVGGVGVALALVAIRRGYRPNLRRALWCGLLLTVLAVLVPPFGSADHVNYAAYGRIAAQGGDPYVEPPADWHGGHDPVTSAVEAPWQRTPSIYGPIATSLMATASLIAGDHLRTTVWIWQLLCGAAWFATGWLVVGLARRRAGPDSPEAARALWLWLLNPVLFGVLLIGAHIDVIGAALMIAALVIVTRQPLIGGLLLGAAAGTKLTLLLAVPAFLWALRHVGPERYARVAGWFMAGVVAVVVPGHLWSGPHVFDQLRRARYFVSLATPWRPFVDWLTGPFDHLTVRRAVVVLTPFAVAALAVCLWRAVPRTSHETVESPATQGDRVVADGAVALLVLLGAYVVAAPYSLPWYDAAAWAPLAVVATSAVDVVLLVRLVAYAIAYVPGRVIDMTPTVQRLTLDVRRDVTPWVGWAVVLALVALAVSGRANPPTRPGGSTSR